MSYRPVLQDRRKIPDFGNAACDVCGRWLQCADGACIDCWKARYDAQLAVTAALVGATYGIAEAYEGFEHSEPVKAILALRSEKVL